MGQFGLALCPAVGHTNFPGGRGEQSAGRFWLVNKDRQWLRPLAECGVQDVCPTCQVILFATGGSWLSGVWFSLWTFFWSRC